MHRRQPVIVPGDTGVTAPDLGPGPQFLGPSHPAPDPNVTSATLAETLALEY